MKNSNVPQRNTVSNEVKVDLNVFGALVLDGIRGHVHNAHVVAKDNNGTMKWAMKLLEELAKLTCLGDGVGNNPILRFSTRARHRVLTLGRPRDEVVARRGRCSTRRWSAGCLDSQPSPRRCRRRGDPSRKV